MARRVASIAALVQLLVIVNFDSWNRQRAGLMAEGRMEAQFEKCCGLGTSWAKEGLRCGKFTGPVAGVPTVEQGLCLEAVDICCVRAYHEQQCEKGKSDARAGLACIKSTASKTPGRGDYHRDCCEGCKLGILTGSMGQGCAFKSFTFGIPWDPAFLECCHEALPSTTTDLTSESTFTTYSSSEGTETSSSWSPSSPSSPSSSSSSASPSSLSSSSSSSFSASSSTSAATSYSPSIPTPSLDDICQLIKGLCSDICVPTPGSYYCACREGFTLLEDGKTCRQNLPTDRCKGINPCQQRCTDTGVAVICSCNPGFILADDKRTCDPITSRNKPESDEDNELAPLCPAGYRYNATHGVCNDKDECIEDDPCPGQCINTIGSYLCMEAPRNTYETCPPGYQWEQRTQVCVDIDECTVLTNPCNQTGLWCVNTQGSFTCLQMKSSRSCPAGFKYDNITRTCKDVDECAEMIHGCQNGTEECRNTEGAYECDVKCGKGFVYSIGLGTCVDIDECTESSRPCPEPGTRCINTMGGYECSRSFDDTVSGSGQKSDPVACPAGYKVTNNPPGACIDVDECNEELHSCEPNEDCVNKLGSYRCESREELGDDLIGEENGNENDERDLQYGTGRRGISTTIPLAGNEAEVARCQPGFTFDARLRRCVDVDECANDYTACGIGERCVNRIGGYDCSPVCSAGFQVVEYRGSESCQDIDECRVGLHTCNTATHTCLNTNGSYVCQILTTTSTTTTTTTTTTPRPPIYSRSNKIQQSAEQYWSIEQCRLGYRRDQSTGYCVDIDECRVGPGCRDHEKCHNTPGGYECSPLCSTGWFFNPTTKGCQDVDECLLGRHDCQQGTHQCVNTNGSYTCQVIPPCRSGFRRSFNGSCADIDECAEKLHNCRLEMHQYCINREGYFECMTRLPSCPTGYRYSISARDCEDIDECATGRYTCDVRFSERCVNLPGTYRCERPSSHGQRQRQRPACPSGYHYDPHLRRCTDVDECAEGLDSCGDETCYNQPGGYTCSKVPTPMTRRPPTTPLPAPANEKCMDGTRFVRNRGCVDIDECRETEDACSSNEQCVNTMGSYTCNCRTGFRRENLTQACVDINECQLQQNDCLPTQRCDNTIGSYICTRFLPCGTGYTLNAATEICEDDDECLLGTHDCGEGYHCRNTLGSYRCDRNSRVLPPQARTSPAKPFTTTTTTTTTTPRSLTPHSERISCPRGFEPGPGGRCTDIDECQRNPNPCGRSMQRCINTMGSYRCASRVICGKGYTLDESGQHCVDVDECADGSHQCASEQTCENRQGSYLCTCPPGHVEGPNRDCVDIDECSIYNGRVCGSNSQCENTVGSYKCNCEAGFENVDGGGGGSCQDVDECQRSPGLCQHVCVNTWGSYRCGCELGYRLSADNRSCTDIDECTEFKSNNLCIGICENTPGSYSCKCPDGYRLGTDGRTCQDIDECSSGLACRRPGEMCQNTRGGFRCNRIDCPSGYYRDTERKNRCMRASTYCQAGDLACFRSPSHFTYNFITFVSMLPMPPSGQLELFTMRGSHLSTSMIQFSMALVDARAPPGVQRATESCFALRRPAPSQAVLVMTRSIQGPQEIELDLSMEIYHNAVFAGSAVAKLFIFVTQYEF